MLDSLLYRQFRCSLGLLHAALDGLSQFVGLLQLQHPIPASGTHADGYPSRCSLYYSFHNCTFLRFCVQSYDLARIKQRNSIFFLSNVRKFRLTADYADYTDFASDWHGIVFFVRFSPCQSAAFTFLLPFDGDDLAVSYVEAGLGGVGNLEAENVER